LFIKFAGTAHLIELINIQKNQKSYIINNYFVVSMVYILSPARARFKDDVEIRARLLEETVRGTYSAGFEVVLGGGPDGDLTMQDDICRNLDSFSQNPDFYISVYSPVERSDYTKRHTDLTTEQGLETFVKVLQLSQKINAKTVNVHSENFHLGKGLLQKDISAEEKQSLQERVKKQYCPGKTSYRIQWNHNHRNHALPFDG
jgi:hypothetical protein